MTYAQRYRIRIVPSGCSLAERHVRLNENDWPEYYTVRRDHDSGDETDSPKEIL